MIASKPLQDLLETLEETPTLLQDLLACVRAIFIACLVDSCIVGWLVGLWAGAGWLHGGLIGWLVDRSDGRLVCKLVEDKTRLETLG